ncbi:MAG: hypothetical protein ABI847_09860 [Anaerolineales bacterium]
MTRQPVNTIASAPMRNTSATGRGLMAAPCSCDTRNVEGPVLESIVWNGLAALLLDEEALSDNLEVERKEAKELARSHNNLWPCLKPKTARTQTV